MITSVYPEAIRSSSLVKVIDTLTIDSHQVISEEYDLIEVTILNIHTEYVLFGEVVEHE